MVGLNNSIAEGSGADPDFDVEIDDGHGVVMAINECFVESQQARHGRDRQNDRNWQTFLGRQDWSHKQAGQSTEFIPKVPVSVEQLSALI